MSQLRSVPAPDSTNLTVVDAPEANLTADATISRAERPRYPNTENTDILPRTPQHRRQPTSAARGRVLIAAMAVGATAAAAYTTMTAPHEVPTTTRTGLAPERGPREGIPGPKPLAGR